MQYLSSYYWQQEECVLTSLVLQQIVYRKGKVPVLFACICTGESPSDRENSTYFGEQLTEWFREQHRSLAKCVRKDATVRSVEEVANRLDEVENELRRKMQQIDRELSAHNQLCEKPMSEIHVAGLLCTGNRFWLFGRGNTRAYLLNKRFERANCVCLSGKGLSGKMEVLSGLMEEDIGLLLATGDFSANITEPELQECLAVKEVKSQEQAKRRLQELGSVAEQRGGQHMGAIFMITR